MGKSETSEQIQQKVGELIVNAAKLPVVHVDRAKYLRAAFAQHCDTEMLDRVVELGPHAAGVPLKVIKLQASSTMKHEVAVATTLSMAAGVPGGWAMLATIPADLIQFNGGLIRTAQKLAYLHDWPELFKVKGDEIDDQTKSVILVFIGVMFGVQTANTLILKLAAQLEAHMGNQLLAKALTKTSYYPLIKNIVVSLGGRMNKAIFANGASKVVPLAGAVLSGGLTFFSFRAMANRLNKHLLSVQASKKRAQRRTAVASQ